MPPINLTGHILTLMAPITRMLLGILRIGVSFKGGEREQRHSAPPCMYFGIPPCQQVALQPGLTRQPPLITLTTRVLALPSLFRSVRYSGTGLPVLSMRWPRRLGAELHHLGSCNVGRGVEIPLGSQVGIPNGQVVLGQELVKHPTLQTVNNLE
jgi:hypothetical protein